MTSHSLLPLHLRDDTGRFFFVQKVLESIEALATVRDVS